jgi:hypothetical protein
MRSDEHYSSVTFRLTPTERERVKAALGDTMSYRTVTPRQRAALMEICSGEDRWNYPPEHVLVAFKAALSDAADQSGIPHGGERDDLLSSLVSAFIEELFRAPPPGNSAGSASDLFANDRLTTRGR